MSTKDFALRIGGTIFGIIAILHLLRIVTKATVIIAGWILPLWVSYIGVIVAGFLCGWMWLSSNNKKSDSAYYITDRNRYK